LSDLTNVGVVGPNSVIATQPPSTTDVEGWSTKQLIDHLQDKFLDDLDNEDLKILKDQKFRGRAFLTLTEEKLERYGMKGGPAGVIAGYIDELKGT
jgi:hypothetical protein